MGVESNRWLELLRAEAARTSVTEAARKIGYARTSVSLAINGHYTAGTAKLAATVLDTLAGRVDCPALGRDIAATDCADRQARPMPTSNPRELKNWRLCRDCVHARGGDDAER